MSSVHSINTANTLHLHGSGAIAALGDNFLQLGNARPRPVKGHRGAAGNAVHAHLFDPGLGAERPFELAHTVIAPHSRNRDLAGLERLVTLHWFNLVHNQPFFRTHPRTKPARINRRPARRGVALSAPASWSAPALQPLYTSCANADRPSSVRSAMFIVTTVSARRAKLRQERQERRVDFRSLPSARKPVYTHAAPMELIGTHGPCYYRHGAPDGAFSIAALERV